MGNMLYLDVPEEVPLPNCESSFPPDYGFSGPRKKREPQLTKEEMIALKIPPKFRDYCSHIMRDFLVCKRDNSPFVGYCKHIAHQHHECQYEDLILRMKEYEREKRLRMRQKKLEGKTTDS